MKPAKRVRFTEAELDCLSSLISIANAGVENEGDYQGHDYKSMDSAHTKIVALLQRIREKKDE